MNILGISAYYHDSAVALLQEGRIRVAAQEERFTRLKHDYRFPVHAIRYCLEEAGLRPDQLDFVGFYDKPLLKFDRLLETYLSFAPAGFRSFATAMPLWLKSKLHLPREIRRGLDGQYRKRIVFTEHHQSHAASAFFPSPFDEAAILTVDGVGEWATATIGTGEGNRIQLTHQLSFPHSLGLLYSAFTYFTGFRVNSGEYKLMGLAPYGSPVYCDVILEKLIDLKDDGSFRLDLSYFNYCQGLTMTSRKFDRLFGRPPRRPESPITQQDMDLAASIQKVTEEILMRAARHTRHMTGKRHLCLAGGVALNCVGNGRILREGLFDELWIQPAAGDAGGALGAALFIWHQLLDRPREANPLDSQEGSLLGPRFGEDEIGGFLQEVGARFQHFPDEEVLCDQVAALLAEGKVVGWMQGRMEFGPRALGNRSILGDPRDPRTQSVMNLKIKFRESFRPFAPSVLEECVSDYFEFPTGFASPYMLLVAPVRENQRTGEPPEIGQGFKRLNAKRSTIPAVTHVDYSARVQTVDRARNPRYHRLLRAFLDKTGCPLVVNTSFNVRGEPIVCTPQDSYRCFMATEMDCLVMGDFLLHKTEQPVDQSVKRSEHLSQFELD